MKYDPRHIILRALTTEKSLTMREKQHCYTFEVACDANKLQVSRAVEELFKVHVLSVRTINVRGKLKRLGRFTGRRPASKKAYVTIHSEGHIELFENV